MRRKKKDWEEKIANFCYRAFWPVLVMWAIVAVIKLTIIIMRLT